MKLVVRLFLLCLIARCEGQSAKCWSTRNEKVAMRTAMQDTICKEPRDTLVQIKVPDGYDKAYPGAVIAKRCTGLVCTRLDQECIPYGNVTKKIIKVEAIAMIGPVKKCFDFEYVEHNACKCSCEKTQESCTQNRVFNKKRCSCDCPSKIMENCSLRMEMMPNTVMWDPVTCSCPCNNWRECGHGEVWASNVCRCVPGRLNDIDSV